MGAPSRAYANMCSHMVICVSIPRFSLLAALGDRRVLAEDAVALGPEPGREQVLGDVSPRAETFGVTAGMRVGEALSRCPELRLVPPDPEGVRGLWAVVLERIESIGGAPESELPGVAYFDARGLRGIHGGSLDGVLEAARHKLGRARLGVAPTRFAAWCAASRTSARRPTLTVDRRRLDGFLRPLPVSLLRVRPELGELPETLERLGVTTLGELAALPAPALAERFGHPGLTARELARGDDVPLAPRRPPEPVTERVELPEGVSGQQLERTLELLIARMLARRERRGRALRAVALSARFVAGGTWRTAVTLRHASAEPERLRIVLKPRLGELPAPAESLALEVEAFGPPAREQTRMLDDGESERRGRLAEAIRQARQAAGEGAALRVLDVDPGSRVPERRSVLAPFPDP
jgi:protein ImuB